MIASIALKFLRLKPKYFFWDTQQFKFLILYKIIINVSIFGHQNRENKASEIWLRQNREILKVLKRKKLKSTCENKYE